MGFDRIIAIGAAISAATLALNTVNDIIGLVQERHQSSKSMLYPQQKALQPPLKGNTILSRPSNQPMIGNAQDNLPRIETTIQIKIESVEFVGIVGILNGTTLSVRVMLGRMIRKI